MVLLIILLYVLNSNNTDSIKILKLNEIENFTFLYSTDSFKVFVVENADSKKNSLCGEYYMTVSPKRVKVKALSRLHELEWSLGSLKRFYLDKENSSALIIESGA